MPKLCVLILLMLFFLARSPNTVLAIRPALSALAKQGNAIMRTGDLVQAERVFRDGLAQARQNADLNYTSGFLTSLGVVRINQAHYRQALDFFLQSQDAAQQVGSIRSAGFAMFNMGVIYSRLGDWRRGHQVILEAVRELAPDQWPSTLHLNLATYESHLARYAIADGYYRQAVDHAERLGIDALVAAAWEQWGLSYLERGEVDPAEICFLESYRMHRLAKRPEAEQVHYGFARVGLARNDLQEARRRAAQYLKAARASPLYFPLWEAYRVSGEIEEKAQNLQRAYELYARGVAWARDARAERVLSPQLMATAEASLQSLYLGLIRVAFDRQVLRPDDNLLQEALEAAEEGRGASFIENQNHLADEYWPLLGRLQQLQARRMAADSPRLESESETLRAQLANLESEAGLRTAYVGNPEQSIQRARSALAPDQALYVFRTGEPFSYAWKITSRTLQLRRLPGEKSLATSVSRFRLDVQNGLALVSEDGKKLFSEIIGEFSSHDSTYQRWTLILDGPLHELPFAALPWPTEGRIGDYLVEHRTLTRAPSIAALAKTSERSITPDSFAGIADPIYNSADPRLSPQTERADLLGLFRSGRSAGYEMARLPGSRAELDAAVSVLTPVNPILLTGTAVNRSAFLSLLSRKVSTLHLATHIVNAPGDSRQALIALGLNSQTREQDLVGAEEINAHRQGARLVVMSGCGSGEGEVLPGVGVLSLTRAWILSGTQGVIASQWAVPDNSGTLFEQFYRYTRQISGPETVRWARALQKAQIESIHQQTPASVWAAYFFTGRN